MYTSILSGLCAYDNTIWSIRLYYLVYVYTIILSGLCVYDHTIWSVYTIILSGLCVNDHTIWSKHTFDLCLIWECMRSVFVNICFCFKDSNLPKPKMWCASSIVKRVRVSGLVQAAYNPLYYQSSSLVCVLLPTRPLCCFTCTILNTSLNTGYTI